MVAAECHISVTAELKNLAGMRKGGKYTALTKPLVYLSVGEHPHHNALTGFAGKLILGAAKDCSIEPTDVKIHIKGNGGAAEAVGELAMTFDHEALRKKGLVTVVVDTANSESKRLFTVPSALTAALIAADARTDQTAELYVSARCARHGATVYSDPIQPKMLMRYMHTARYPPQQPDDGRWGGDGWVRPRARWVCEHLAGIIPGFQVGDISYIHGGDCHDHATHKDGTQVDIKFTDFEKQDETTLANIEAMFKDNTVGSWIEFIYMTMSPAFQKLVRERIRQECQAIPNMADLVIRKCVADATSGGQFKIGHTLIKNINGHSDHYHLSIRP